jgi:hypothetical protein
MHEREFNDAGSCPAVDRLLFITRYRSSATRDRLVGNASPLPAARRSLLMTSGLSQGLGYRLSNRLTNRLANARDGGEAT